MTMKKGTHGAKPPEFCDWILDLIGYQIGDEFDDLYPGTGAMGEAVKRKQNQIYQKGIQNYG